MAKCVAKSLLLSELASWQMYMEETFRGHEQLAILEICRSLDLIFAGAQEGKAVEKTLRDGYYARCGVPEAMKPFLNSENEQSAEYQWAQSTPERASLIRTYLVKCGELVDTLRLVALESYGLAEVTVNRSTIEVRIKSDSCERVATQLNRAMASSRVSRESFEPSQETKKRMLESVRADDRYFISYDLDSEIEQQYLSLAKSRRALFPESEALPDECVVAGRPFKEWREECEKAYARVLCHIEFTRLLCSKKGQVNPGDMLTKVYSRQEVEQLLEQGGTPKGLIGTTIRALTTTADDIERYSSIFEPPTAPYISFGKDNLLAPCYGMVGNPYFAMFRHLRWNYRSDWDAAVDRREDRFRKDISELFCRDRFFVAKAGYRIKRSDGSHSTDVDAIVYDRQTGSLALVQLKWHDPYGRSVTERESRRKNLAKAEEWVGRVQVWLQGRSSEELIRLLGIPARAVEVLPYIYVVSRYASRFAASDRSGLTSTWLSWPELVHAVGEAADDPIRDVAAWVRRETSKKLSTRSHFQMNEFSKFSVVVDAEVIVDEG